MALASLLPLEYPMFPLPVETIPNDDASPLTTAVAEDLDDSGPLGAVVLARRAMNFRDNGRFSPRKPTSLREAGLTPDFVEKLICRSLLVQGSASGRSLGHALGLPFRLIEPILSSLKEDMVLSYRRTAAAGDYEYLLTETGAERARRYMQTCTYAETAPVPLGDYIASVADQTLAQQCITIEDLRDAFADVSLEQSMVDRLGPAVNAGRGMFLYGAPGNGKTTIAERVVRCYGDNVWIPRTILVEDTCIRLFDPVLHQEAVSSDCNVLGEPLEDARWVCIRRPTVVVGGELTMDQLELRHDVVSNVCEASLQMKSNCGVLLIDDFGRQTMPASQLLNRWIVPLEKRYDFQKLPTGKKIQVPFDQLVVFSTNLEPRDLVDEAFLRRLPYKIEVPDPSREQFHLICSLVGPSLGLKPTAQQIDKLLDEHFVAAKRRLRCCHPRDLMLQIRSYCRFRKLPLEFNDAAVAFAVENYFGVM